MRTAAARALYILVGGTSFKRETVGDVKRLQRELRCGSAVVIEHMVS